MGVSLTVNPPIRNVIDATARFTLRVVVVFVADSPSFTSTSPDAYDRRGCYSVM